VRLDDDDVPDDDDEGRDPTGYRSAMAALAYQTDDDDDDGDLPAPGGGAQESPGRRYVDEYGVDSALLDDDDDDGFGFRDDPAANGARGKSDGEEEYTDAFVSEDDR